ncbi:MAG TPA: DUF3089 domain-containing protein [Bryobacteraceae bacterium]|nr:DUF3089 domain-containing protein [Bryobacteraceae bacterium]
MRTRILILSALSLGSAVSAFPQHNDYSDGHNWLCKPGRHDACDVDLTATAIAADGKFNKETWAADPAAPIDCFYVYPTVSLEPTTYSGMVPTDAERNVVRQQFARFAAKCRPYAPMYRQVTLAGLRAMLTGAAPGVRLDRGLQYDDVLDAWNYYLEHDHGGRGVVLFGHSQGSFILDELIRNEIDGKPVQARIVSVIAPGATLPMPKAGDAAFPHIPACKSASQTGCAIVYSTFRSNFPPPDNTYFGKVTANDMVAACMNPAALGGGSGELRAYYTSDGRAVGSGTRTKTWVTPDRPVPTPWVTLPGLLTAECKSQGNTTWLEVTVHPNPAGARVNDITGDIMTGGQVNAAWGLHTVDVNLTIGNLVEIVGKQAAAYAAAHH